MWCVLFTIRNVLIGAFWFGTLRAIENAVLTDAELISGESIISQLPLWDPVQFSFVLWIDEDAIAFYSNFDFLSSL